MQYLIAKFGIPDINIASNSISISYGTYILRLATKVLNIVGAFMCLLLPTCTYLCMRETRKFP